MLKKVQKKLQKETQKKDNETKMIVENLDKCIEEARKAQIGGDFTKVGSSLFEVKVKFKSKHVSKNEYTQLFGLFKYLISNPKYDEGELRRAIRKHPVKYGFLIECDANVENFFAEIKMHGATSMAKNIANQRGALEDFAKKNSLR